MERLLARDAYVRALAVLIAMVLWLYVTSQSLPAATRTVTVPVQPLFLPGGLAVATVEPDQVRVTVRGPLSQLDRLDPGRVQATVDLREAAPGRTVRLVDVALPSGLELAQVLPPQVTVVLDRLASRGVPVVVDVTGEPPAGLRALPPVVRPGRVTVRGGASAVERVVRVVAGIDVHGAERSVRQVLPVYAVDAAGQPVLGVTLIPDRVEVEVPVAAAPVETRLPVRAVVTGVPAAGYALVSIRVEPEYALVRAAPDALAGLAALETEPVSVEGARATVEAEVALRPPAAVEQVDPPRVRVTATVQRAP